MVCCIIIVLVSSWSKEHVKLAFHLHFFILPIIKLQHEKVKISVKTSSNISSYEWPGTYFMLWRTVKIFRAPTLCAEIHVQIPVLSFSGLFTFESVPFLGAFISVPTQKQLFQTKTFTPPHPPTPQWFSMYITPQRLYILVWTGETVLLSHMHHKIYSSISAELVRLYQ